MKRLAILGVLAVIAAAVAMLAAAESAPAPDVLIIHASGTPFEGFANLTPANVDAVSTPTPVVVNARAVAEQAAEALRAKQLVVRVAETAEIRSRDELLRPRLVVLASPAYFGSCSWRMHKLIHEPLWQIFALGGKRLDGRVFAAIATARSEASAKSAADVMLGAVKSCNGKPGPTMAVLIGDAPEKIKERAARFADEAVAAMPAK